MHTGHQKIGFQTLKQITVTVSHVMWYHKLLTFQLNSTNNVKSWHDISHSIPLFILNIQRLQPIWKCRAISKEIKLWLYSSIVVPTATYACETWKTTAKATKMIHVFHRRCLRRILGISWCDHITNDEVMTCSGQIALHDIVATRRRRFIKHILRLPPTRLASLAIEWRPEDGKRNIGRPNRTWQDTLKEDLEVMGIDWSDKTTAASNRANWRWIVDQCSTQNLRN